MSSWCSQPRNICWIRGCHQGSLRFHGTLKQSVISLAELWSSCPLLPLSEFSYLVLPVLFCWKSLKLWLNGSDTATSLHHSLFLLSSLGCQEPMDFFAYRVHFWLSVNGLLSWMPCLCCSQKCDISANSNPVVSVLRTAGYSCWALR